MNKGKKLLLLDHEMFHPEVHRMVMKFVSEKGWNITYRRYFPHFCNSDKDYDVVMVYGGRTPGVPGGQMSYLEVDRLAEYALNGGMLVLAAYGGSREERGAHERYLFNKVLEKAGVNIRINDDWVTDEANGYPSTLVPSSYLYPLPMIRPFPGSPIGDGIDILYGGYQSSYAVGENAAVLLESFPTSILIDYEKEYHPAKIIGGPKSYKLSAAARAGKGYIIVISRYILNMGDFTGRTSDLE